MRLSIAVGLCISLLLVDFATAQSTRNNSYRVNVGQAHPDFVFPNIKDGKPTRLSDFRGKKVLLVHFASW